MVILVPAPGLEPGRPKAVVFEATSSTDSVRRAFRFGADERTRTSTPQGRQSLNLVRLPFPPHRHFVWWVRWDSHPRWEAKASIRLKVEALRCSGHEPRYSWRVWWDSHPRCTCVTRLRVSALRCSGHTPLMITCDLLDHYLVLVPPSGFEPDHPQYEREALPIGGGVVGASGRSPTFPLPVPRGEYQSNRWRCWSAYQDLNLGPPASRAGALPDCATHRYCYAHGTSRKACVAGYKLFGLLNWSRTQESNLPCSAPKADASRRSANPRWSTWLDLNQRPPVTETGALPSCATRR